MKFEHRWADGSECRAVYDPWGRDEKWRASVSCGRCRPPCSCDGYEVCLHQHRGGSRSPIWPIFTVATAKAAKALASAMRIWARMMTEEQIAALRDGGAVKEWGEARGFGVRRSHCVVARRAAGGGAYAIPPEILKPGPADPTGSVRAALIEERRNGR